MPSDPHAPRDDVQAATPAVRHIAKSAARRGLARDAARVLGPALTIGAAIALALALADRLIGPGIHWGWLIGIPVALATLVAIVRIATIRRGPVHATWTVDRALALDERLSSAVSLAHRATTDPFAQLAVEEAESVARTVNVRRAIPMHFGKWWYAWPVVAAAAIAIGILLQPMRLLADHIAIEQARLEEARRSDATAAIDEAIDAITPAPEETPIDDPTIADAAEPPPELIAPEEREALEQIRKQLAQGERTPEEARSEAANVLGDAAEAREQRAEETRAQEEALRKLLESMPQSAPGDNTAGNRATQDFGRALRDGDLERAAKALEELQQQIEQMNPEQREQVAQELDDLAKELEQAAQDSAEQREQNAEQAIEDLRDRGLSEETAQDIAQESDPDAATDALKDQGMDEQSARDLAERTAEAQREREAAEQAERDAQQLADDLKQSADEAREPERQQKPEPNQQESDPTDGAQQQDNKAPTEQQRDQSQQDQQQQQPGDGQPNKQGDAKQPSNDPGKQPGDSKPRPDQQSPGQSPDGAKGNQSAKPDEQGQPTTDPKGAPKDGRPAQQPQDAQGSSNSPDQREENEPTGATNDSNTPGENPGEQENSGQAPGGKQQPNNGTPSNGAQPKPGEQPEGPAPFDQQPPQDGGGAQPPENAPPGGAPGQPKDTAAPAPGQPAQQQPDSSGDPAGQSTPPNNPNSPGSGAGDGNESPLDNLHKRLQKMSEQHDNASRDQRAADALRKQQQQLLDQMTPEQREELMRLARNRQIEQGDPEDRATTPFDARRPGEHLGPQDVAGQVDNPNPAPRQASGDAPAQNIHQELVDRREEIRRAIEEKRVPARYRNIEEYFRRTAEDAQKNTDAAPTPAETPAPNAPSNDS
ncbi:MAG: hypothetical protein KDA20_08135 [Phycisphaerales bacterium]|nr:hypothetical protein [Phycisphaerales bacterium]